MKNNFYFLLAVLFVSCNNFSNKGNIKDNRDDTTVQQLNNYPPEVVKRHYEKKYDNAVWLFYASNFHANNIICLCKHQEITYIGTSIILFYPFLNSLEEWGDTVEFSFVLHTKSDTCTCYPCQQYAYLTFGFLKKSDNVLYRGTQNWKPSPDAHGNLWNKDDSIEILSLFPRKGKDKNMPIFNRNYGQYPIDEQAELFIQYLKSHKNQIAPPLLRLCRERKIF